MPHVERRACPICRQPTEIRKDHRLRHHRFYEERRVYNWHQNYWRVVLVSMGKCPASDKLYWQVKPAPIIGGEKLKIVDAILEITIEGTVMKLEEYDKIRTARLRANQGHLQVNAIKRADYRSELKSALVKHPELIGDDLKGILAGTLGSGEQYVVWSRIRKYMAPGERPEHIPGKLALILLRLIGTYCYYQAPTYIDKIWHKDLMITEQAELTKALASAIGESWALWREEEKK